MRRGSKNKALGRKQGADVARSVSRQSLLLSKPHSLGMRSLASPCANIFFVNPVSHRAELQALRASQTRAALPHTAADCALQLPRRQFTAPLHELSVSHIVGPLPPPRIHRRDGHRLRKDDGRDAAARARSGAGSQGTEGACCIRWPGQLPRRGRCPAARHGSAAPRLPPQRSPA